MYGTVEGYVEGEDEEDILLYHIVAERTTTYGDPNFGKLKIHICSLL